MTGPLRDGDARSTASVDRPDDWRGAGPSERPEANGSRASTDRVRNDAAAGPKRRGVR